MNGVSDDDGDGDDWESGDGEVGKFLCFFDGKGRSSFIRWLGVFRSKFQTKAPALALQNLTGEVACVVLCSS